MSSQSDTDPITVVAGHEMLTSMFGRWPSFHDAEVVDLHLWRGEVKPGGWDDSNVFPVLTVKLRIPEATQIGATDAGHDVLATLRFHDVDDLKLEGFNHVNQIVDYPFRFNRAVSSLTAVRFLHTSLLILRTASE